MRVAELALLDDWMIDSGFASQEPLLCCVMLHSAVQDADGAAIQDSFVKQDVIHYRNRASLNFTYPVSLDCNI